MRTITVGQNGEKEIAQDKESGTDDLVIQKQLEISCQEVY